MADTRQTIRVEFPSEVTERLRWIAEQVDRDVHEIVRGIVLQWLLERGLGDAL